MHGSARRPFHVTTPATLGLCAVVALATSCRDTTHAPLEPHGLQPRFMYADCDPDFPETCEARRGDASFNATQITAMNNAAFAVSADETCQSFLSFLSGLNANGGLFIYNSRLTDYGSTQTLTESGGPIDFQSEIRLGQYAFNSGQKELARTMVHEAAHAVLGANDAPASAGASSANYWEARCVP